MPRSPSRGLVIRQAVSTDATAATAIARLAKASWGYPSDWLAAWQEELTFTAAACDAQPAYVAEFDGIVVGICVLESDRDHWELSHLWVDPAAQRRGVGRALLETVGTYMREHGIGSCRIVSDPYAEPFYLSQGARRIGQVPAPMPGAAERMLPLMEWPVPSAPG